mgnify:CR=1 FL=1
MSLLTITNFHKNINPAKLGIGYKTIYQHRQNKTYRTMFAEDLIIPNEWMTANIKVKKLFYGGGFHIIPSKFKAFFYHVLFSIGDDYIIYNHPFYNLLFVKCNYDRILCSGVDVSGFKVIVAERIRYILPNEKLLTHSNFNENEFELNSIKQQINKA